MNREQFKKDVLSLFKAGWDTKRIGIWAMSAASGFAREWKSPDHAYYTVNDICRGYNREVGAENRRLRAAAIAKVMEDPKVAALVRQGKGKWVFR